MLLIEGIVRVSCVVTIHSTRSLFEELRIIFAFRLYSIFFFFLPNSRPSFVRAKEKENAIAACCSFTSCGRSTVLLGPVV